MMKQQIWWGVVFFCLSGVVVAEQRHGTVYRSQGRAVAPRLSSEAMRKIEFRAVQGKEKLNPKYYKTKNNWVFFEFEGDRYAWNYAKAELRKRDRRTGTYLAYQHTLPLPELTPLNKIYKDNPNYVTYFQPNLLKGPTSELPALNENEPMKVTMGMFFLNKAERSTTGQSWKPRRPQGWDELPMGVWHCFS